MIKTRKKELEIILTGRHAEQYNNKQEKQEKTFYSLLLIMSFISATAGFVWAYILFGV